MVGYDFQCNLACPSCRNGHLVQSDAERAEVEKITERLLSTGDLEHVNVLGISGGGDPLASAGCRHLLSSIPWIRLPRLRVSLHTNGLLLDAQHWRDLGVAAERTREIRISVDAVTPETYHENRGGNWRALLRGLDFASAMRRSRAIDRLYLNFVVQANNMEEMPTFALLAGALGADVVDWGKLAQWGTYDPDDYRRRAVHLLEHPLHSRYLELRASADKIFTRK